MSSKSIVYGFIELDPQFSEFNERVMNEFPFDESFPFTNVFGSIVSGYESAVVSFGGSYKSLFEDWDEWEGKFSTLLSRLYCRSATVQISDDVEGTQNVRYVCDDGWETTIEPTSRKWGKWRTDSSGKTVEENGLLNGSAEV